MIVVAKGLWLWSWLCYIRDHQWEGWVDASGRVCARCLRIEAFKWGGMSR